MGSQKLAIQIHSVHTKEEVEIQTLKDQYLEGNYTEFESRRKREKIQKLVGINVGDRMVKSVVIEWKRNHIPAEQLIIEYRNVCEDVATEQQDSTVTPHLQSKLHRLEELILDRL